MNPGLAKAFDAEMTAAAGLYAAGELAGASRHLEVAHVLGQKFVLPRMATHYWMLKVGLRRRSISEVAGQGMRIALGALGLAVGIVPVGNTGGTNIGVFKRLPVDPRVQELIKQAALS